MARLLLFSATLLCQTENPSPSSPDEIAAAVAGLASDTFERRETSTNFLWRAWPASRSALEAAAKSKDAEVSLRAKRVLDQVRYGILPETPPQIVQLIGKYREGDANAKRDTLRQLRELRQQNVVLVLL